MYKLRAKLISLIAGLMPVALNLRVRGTLDLASPGIVQNVTVQTVTID